MSQLAWSGGVAELQHLAQIVQDIIEPFVTPRADALAKETAESYQFLGDPEKIDAKVRERVDDFLDEAMPKVELSYRRHDQKQIGAISELAQVDTHELTGVVLSAGRSSDRPRVEVKLSRDKIEATVWAEDTGYLVGTLAKLKDVLRRGRPGWAFVRSKWTGAAVALLWVGLVAWWSSHWLDSAADVAFISLYAGGISAIFLGSVATNITPAFEALNDRGEGPVRRWLKVLGWVTPVALTILFGLPVFL